MNLVATKLYVGGLPYQMSEEQLHGIFSEVGDVQSVRIVIDRDSGRSKGFGFVEMANEELAQKAIEAINGSLQGGRALIVNIARPPEERAPRSGGFGGDRRNDSRGPRRSY